MKKEKALVTGSHGLVGSETVDLLCDNGFEVVGIDNDTRAYLFGVEASTSPVGRRLLENHSNYSAVGIDIRSEKDISGFMENEGPFDLIVHAAAQPAHEWSTNNALEDFRINAVGTMVMLESYRQHSPDATFIHVSSSKVYGNTVNDLPLKEFDTRYDLPKEHENWWGMREDDQTLEGRQHSLFGASKAAADIMAREYGTYFDLPINIFRPVCITGSAHQGTELHGYLAYLGKCVATGQEYTINGYKGKQVRDNIHASDLANAFLTVHQHREKIKPGEVYNIGGGRKSNNSMTEAINQFQEILGREANVKYSDEARKGDHKWCIFDSAKFKSDFPDWRLKHDNDSIMQEICQRYT